MKVTPSENPNPELREVEGGVVRADAHDVGRPTYLSLDLAMEAKHAALLEVENWLEHHSNAEGAENLLAIVRRGIVTGRPTRRTVGRKCRAPAPTSDPLYPTAPMPRLPGEVDHG